MGEIFWEGARETQHGTFVQTGPDQEALHTPYQMRLWQGQPLVLPRLGYTGEKWGTNTLRLLPGVDGSQQAAGLRISIQSLWLSLISLRHPLIAYALFITRSKKEPCIKTSLCLFWTRCDFSHGKNS